MAGFILILSLVGGYEIVSLWRGLYLYQKKPETERLFQAILINPSDPDPYYRLGFFYQWDIKSLDLKESKRFLLKAIERNPLEQRYWIALARVMKRLGEREAFERAIENSVYLFPTGYLGRWSAANLYLEVGSFEKAIGHLSYLLQHYPNQTSQIYDLLFRVIPDSETILEKVVPRDSLSFQRFLGYLYEVGERDGAKRVWQKKAYFNWRPSRMDSLRHIEFLINSGDLGEAFRVWRETLKAEGIEGPSDENLITNPSFEKKELLGGGFDWRVEKVSGAEVSFDNKDFFEGKSCLKIVFNGKENIDFYHVFQYVAWKPDTEYLLKARLKTRDLTTKSGIKIEVLSMDGKFRASSEGLTGNNDWREVLFPFRSPKGSKGGMVRLRRERTEKFDRYISGVVWVDNVSLREKRE